MSTVERRSRRSDVPAEALELLLDAWRVRSQLEALVVADAQGVLLGASSADGIDAEEMAALLTEPNRIARQRPTLRVACLSTNGEPLFVGALGPDAASLGAMSGVVDGVRRILSA